MGSEVMVITLQSPDDFRKIGIPVKVSGQKKRGVYFTGSQCPGNEPAAVGKTVACKNESNFLLIPVTPDDSAMVICQGFFFETAPSLSWAASR